MPDLRLADPHRRYTSVRLWQELGLPAEQAELAWTDGAWTLRLASLPVLRMQYLFEVEHGDGGRELLPDPANPLRAGGPFGEHSVVELPGYVRPGWLDVEPVDGTRTAVRAGDLEVCLWAPAGTEPREPLPLLLAHDGPELDAYAALTRWAGASVATDVLPPHRVALLSPGERNGRYSASPGYARELVETVVPAVRAAVEVRGGLVLAGASLGGLAALHAEWTHPGTFAGLHIASGSFFGLRTDAHEIRFDRFWRVAGFVHDVMKADAAPSRPAVSLVWGSAEENAANNRLMAARLGELGLPVATGEVADVHTFTSWRDGWDPHLTQLCRRTWEGG